MTEEEIQRRLKAIEILEPNWDSYGAKKPSADAVELARLIASVPPNHIAPTNKGGVLLVWDTPEEVGSPLVCLELTIGPKGAASIYYEREEGC